MIHTTFIIILQQ